MKFLCSNCKAKYQIADEKVAGRTLRMTCRRCREEIVIHGANDAGMSSYPAPTSAGMHIGMAPGPSALGADFQQQIAGHARAPAPIAPVIDEWHVGINDVPVGPMRREEVARKLSTGAINSESLAWREGLDDWLPIRLIPELAVLLAPQHAIGLPPAGMGYAAPPPPPPAYAQVPPPVYAAPLPPPAAYGGPMPGYAPAPPQVLMQPAHRQELAPIGGRAGAAPAYGAEDWAQKLDHSQAAMNPLLVEAAAAEQRRLTPSWPMMFALAGALSVVMAGVAIFGARWLQGDPQAATPAASGAAGSPAVAAARPEAQRAPGAIDPGVNGELAPEDSTQPARPNAAPRTGSQPRSGTVTAPAASGTKPKKELTEAQKAMLARMGGSETAAVANLQANTATSAGAANRLQGTLKAEHLTQVVTRGRDSLQRCYNSALRSSGSTDSVRMDVSLTVSPNGNVTSVKAAGDALPGMAQCIERTVKLWHFPNATEESATHFPLLFQPGS